jgi:hypothetical protein
MRNKIAIYTAIFGDYDNLIEPQEKIEGCDFYCFTDNKDLKSDLYKIINVEREFSDPTRDARKIKTLSHKYLPEYEYTLWVDANIIFRNFDVQRMFDEFLANHDIAIHKHSARDCVYDEFATCIEIGVDSPSLMTRQIVKYIKDGYPVNNGLAETSVVFRKNTELSKEINEKWWDEIKGGSRRDQISVDYAIWKNRADYCRINDSVRDGKNFYAEKHKEDSYEKRRRELELSNLESIILEMESKNCKKCYLDESKNKIIKDLRNKLDEEDKLISIMRNSVFWKMRNLYVKYKNKLIFGIFHPISFAKKYTKKIFNHIKK